MNCLGLSIKCWSSPDLNSMRWLGLFRNKTFRKHLKLIFPHWDFIIYIVSLEIFHPYFVIRIFPSAFYHPHFIIRIFPSAFFYPPSAAIRSSLYRDLSAVALIHRQPTLQWLFTETKLSSIYRNKPIVTYTCIGP